MRPDCNSASHVIIIQFSLLSVPLKIYFLFSSFFFHSSFLTTDFPRHLIQGDGRSMKTRLCARGWLKLGVRRYLSSPNSTVFAFTVNARILSSTPVFFFSLFCPWIA